jgi:hypothetical protein
MDPIPLLLLSLVLSIPITFATNLLTPTASRQVARLADWWSAKRAARAEDDRDVAIYFARYADAFTQALIIRAMRLTATAAWLAITGVPYALWAADPGPRSIFQFFWQVTFFVVLALTIQTLFSTYALHRRVRDAWHELKDVEEGITPLDEAAPDLADILRTVAERRPPTADRTSLLRQSRPEDPQQN